jgi:surface antigen
MTVGSVGSPSFGGFMSDPTLQDITYDPNSIPDVSSSTTAAVTTAGDQWSGLDDLGSTTSNVASSILGGFGNLVTAQLNSTALLTATGAKAKALTNAPTTNPNYWQYFVIAGVVAIAGFAIYKAVKS